MKRNKRVGGGGAERTPLIIHDTVRSLKLMNLRHMSKDLIPYQLQEKSKSTPKLIIS